MLVARVVAVVVVGVLLAAVGARLRHPSDAETVLAVRFEQHYGLGVDGLRCAIAKKPATYGCQEVVKGLGAGEDRRCILRWWPRLPSRTSDGRARLRHLATLGSGSRVCRIR
jgi:hypothetical protein